MTLLLVVHFHVGVVGSRFLQELKHGRTAMIGITGMYFQTITQGKPILAQLSEAFSVPDEVAKAGYFFPTEGE